MPNISDGRSPKRGVGKLTKSRDLKKNSGLERVWSSTIERTCIDFINFEFDLLTLFPFDLTDRFALGFFFLQL